MSKEKPPEPLLDAEVENEQDQTVHVRLDKELRDELDTIIGWMKTDPAIRRLRINKIGREKALRYAIGHCLAHPPQHVRPADA